VIIRVARADGEETSDADLDFMTLGRAFGRPFLLVATPVSSTLREASPMSELILHKKARQLCIGEGKAWSLKDFENGVPGVTMLTVVVNGKKRREYLNRAKVMLKGNSR
jgi:hypothetical protein